MRMCLFRCTCYHDHYHIINIRTLSEAAASFFLINIDTIQKEPWQKGFKPWSSRALVAVEIHSLHERKWISFHMVFSCDQAAPLSVGLPVRPSVTPFSLSSHHHIIMKFSSVIMNDKSDVHTKGQRSDDKVTEVKTQLSCFRIVTPVWIYIWWWNDAQSLMLHRRGSLLFFKVIR